MQIDEMMDSLAGEGMQQTFAEPVKQPKPSAEVVASLSEVIDREQRVAKRLDQYPISKAVYDLVCRNDDNALRILRNRIRVFTWRIPPFDPSDQQSAASEHLWDSILKKTGNDPRPEIVLPLAMDGAFDLIPYEVRNRFIDDARKASAKKRGGDGEHIPVFDALTADGEPERRSDQDFDFDEGDAQRQRPKGGRIEHETRDLWFHVTEDIRREELAADPGIDFELGPASRLYRFYLEHLDERWTDVEVARELGVTDRTIRNYRRMLIPFVNKL